MGYRSSDRQVNMRSVDEAHVLADERALRMRLCHGTEDVVTQGLVPVMDEVAEPNAGAEPIDHRAEA